MPALRFSLLFSALAIFATAVPEGFAYRSPAEANRRRGDCVFSGAINVTSVATQLSVCQSLTINNVTVPAGKTLDLTGLADGTTVTFQGRTTWSVRKGFAGPLLTIGGKNIVVTGAAGAILDGQGPEYWDGLGSNGNSSKPKFLTAQGLIGASSINNLYLLNTPVQAVSINHCNGLTISHMTIDNSASDDLPLNKSGHNTDGFDIASSSSNIVIDSAIVHNQDDCVAINSGTVSAGSFVGQHAVADDRRRISPSRTDSASAAMASLLVQWGTHALPPAILFVTFVFSTPASRIPRMDCV